jgi:arginine N-succinyltransferase
MHPNCFKERILAEMRPSFDTEGHQAFWHAFGERFTGMSYDEADRRSAADKGFILDLFPSTPFYASLLDDEAIAELGHVNEEARPALRLLERAGFHWIGQIDPFDAAPYYGAAVSEVVPISGTRHVRVGSGAPSEDASIWIASSEEQGEFRAVATRAERVGDWGRLPKEARERLEVIDGDDLVLTPLPDRREGRGSRV